MTSKQNRRALADLRHQKRAEKLQQYRKQKQQPFNKKQNAPVPTGQKATVAGVFGSECLVYGEGIYYRCKAYGGIAVGDQVLIADGVVRRALARTTVLSRPDPSDPLRERVLAANVDLVIIVASVGVPPLRPGLIDRITIAAARGGAQVLICVNKYDLGLSSDDRNALALYSVLEVPVILCSCFTGQGLDELSDRMRGLTCVFAGHSGVGKSSLINALCPNVGLATGEVGKKGRHTTSCSSLHVEPDGTRLIDTPGIREFGLWSITPDELRGYFPEFSALPCAYRDCMHTHEPGCAVRDAGMSRYPAYLRLLSSL